VSGKRRKKRNQIAPYRQQQLPNQSITHVQSLSFSGPLPPPEILAKFNEVVPGAADRLIAMAERQSAHREALETAVVQGGLESQKRGSWFGFLGGHCKTGHTGSPENRPIEFIQDRVVLLHDVM
jgi:uncharacterized membrane protein